jgi:predicted enzyme related to lactoylglutathione lyase
MTDRPILQIGDSSAPSLEYRYSRCLSVERTSLDIQLTPAEGTMTDTTAAINATNLGCSITCKDLEASIRFYRDAVGFAVAQTFENAGKVVAAVVAAGDCRIVLNQDDGQLGWDRKKGLGFYLQINVAGAADVDAAAARIKAGGGALLSEPADRPWGARMFQFNDLDGFKLGVSAPLMG